MFTLLDKRACFLPSSHLLVDRILDSFSCNLLLFLNIVLSRVTRAGVQPSVGALARTWHTQGPGFHLQHRVKGRREGGEGEQGGEKKLERDSRREAE